MKYSDWIENVEPHCTKTGARLDIRMYVYPDGHGNIFLLHPDEKSGQPVNDFDEAVRVFQDLWNKASTTRRADESEGRSTLVEMLQRITPENLHGEIPDGSPVGNEVW